MTRKTKLHQVQTKEHTLIYRDLNVKEVGLLLGIQSETIRLEMAAKLAITNLTDTIDIPIGLLLQIGSNALSNSVKVIQDKELCELTIKEFRSQLSEETSSAMGLVIEILKVLPGQSFTDLLELTFEDLVELVCVCEE
jgi:hypothetical protein